MEWVCVVLIIGTMLYIGGIVLDYSNHDTRLRPQIVKLKRQAMDFAELAELELAERDQARERAEMHRPAIEDLQLKIDTIRSKNKAENIRKNRLEMVLLKTSLRHTPRMSFVGG